MRIDQAIKGEQRQYLEAAHRGRHHIWQIHTTAGDMAWLAPHRAKELPKPIRGRERSRKNNRPKTSHSRDSRADQRQRELIIGLNLGAIQRNDRILQSWRLINKQFTVLMLL